MNEQFRPLFEAGATDPKKKIGPFGKRDVEKINSGKKETDDVRFTRFLAQQTSTGDLELDELRTEYIALQAFNELAHDSGLYDSMEEERMREQIMKRLRKKD